MRGDVAQWPDIPPPTRMCELGLGTPLHGASALASAKCNEECHLLRPVVGSHSQRHLALGTAIQARVIII